MIYQVITNSTLKHMNKIAALTILMMGSLLSFGQQEVMISQYMFNGLVLNPAYAGTHPYWSTSVLSLKSMGWL